MRVPTIEECGFDGEIDAMSETREPFMEWLRETPCDREPLTKHHANCQCRMANAAADELERLRAENAQLRSSLDAMVKHVSNEELARAVDAAKKRIDSSEQGGGI